MGDKRFVIRVYAIITNEQNQVLLSDEYVLDTYMTKFPGGGLEWGEGPVDCLKREAIEEFGQSVDIISHFYTTDYFQKALFYEETQLISIYYLAKFTEPIQFKISTKPFDFEEKVNGNQSFRWVTIDELNPEELTFPIDKKVAQMLKNIKPVL
jgi:ADP-ribose pyrophosphatase YjhB (NUDIX family)